MPHRAPPVNRAKITYSDGSVVNVPVEDGNEFHALAEAIAKNKAVVLRYAAIPAPTSRGPRPVAVSYEEADLTPTRR